MVAKATGRPQTRRSKGESSVSRSPTSTSSVPHSLPSSLLVLLPERWTRILLETSPTTLDSQLGPTCPQSTWSRRKGWSLSKAGWAKASSFLLSSSSKVHSTWSVHLYSAPRFTTDSAHPSRRVLGSSTFLETETCGADFRRSPSLPAVHPRLSSLQSIYLLFFERSLLPLPPRLFPLTAGSRTSPSWTGSFETPPRSVASFESFRTSPSIFWTSCRICSWVFRYWPMCEPPST